MRRAIRYADGRRKLMLQSRSTVVALTLAVAGTTVAASIQTPRQPRATHALPEVIRELPLHIGSPSGQPQLAVDNRGRAILSWLERISDSSRYAFKYAYREGSGWTAPRTIVERDNFFVNWADVPSVFPRDDGSLVAHWLQKNGSGTYAYDVRIAASDRAALKWTADRLPYADTSQTEHGFGSFFVWPGGGTGIAWLDGREMKPGGHDGHGGGAMTLRAARVGSDATATVTQESQLDARVCECCPTAAIGTPNGAIVAYRDRSETEVRDIAVVRLVNGKWEKPTVVHADGWQISACPVNGPALASSNNRVALAWFTAQGDKPRALLAFSTDEGKTFGPPIRIDETQTLGRVDVAMLDDGRAVAAWLEFLPDGSELRARVIAADGMRGPHVRIATSTSDRQSGYPRMVRSGNELIFAWTATRPSPQVRTAAVTLR